MTKVEIIMHASIYKIFSRCFLYPDEILSQWLTSGKIDQLTEFFLPDISTTKNSASKWYHGYPERLQLLEALQVEYTRLFITGFPKILAPPYKSCYDEKTLNGDSAGKILDIYQQYQFQISEEIKEPPDHLAILLEFVYRVNELPDSKSIQNEFLRAHLGSWLGLFHKRLEAQATLPLYPCLSGSLLKFIEQDLHPITIRVGEASL